MKPTKAWVVFNGNVPLAIDITSEEGAWLDVKVLYGVDSKNRKQSGYRCEQVVITKVKARGK